MRKIYIILIILIFSLSTCSVPHKPDTLKKSLITDNWEFKMSDRDDWFPAKVPGCVYTDLFDNNLIPEPYFANNEESIQWVENKDWEYRCSFKVDSNLISARNIMLVFKGLDTYADIYLNSTKLGDVDNMYREWEYDIKPKLKRGLNNLRVVFHSALKVDSIKAGSLKYKLPDNRGFSRKAPYQYGWDWGPELVSSGIWRPVYIKSWKSFNTKNVNINCTDIIEKKAVLSAEFHVKSEYKQHIDIDIVNTETELILSNYSIELVPGDNHFGWEFEISNPELWWTNGLGKPKLYKLRINIESDDYKQILKKTIGLRTIELVQRPDSFGSSFEFLLNGMPVFMKGANYVPMDNLLGNVSSSRYEKLIADAAEANINMLRVWGGGIYENDLFYDLCDEKGILIWQDFMFACNMYPGDLDFIDNVKEEVKQNIIRLREHPCIALWCGNNEVDNGWKDWGWQQQFSYSSSDSTEIYSNYKRLFNKVLPDLVSLYSPKIPYLPSSPKWGWGHKQSNYEGDSHYWGVWWGMEEFDQYENNVGRFMSEYGFQAYPDLKTINQFTEI